MSDAEKLKAAQDEAIRLWGMLRALVGSVEARLLLDGGFKGMGYNIAQESAGKMRLYCKEARRMLDAADGKVIPHD